VDTAIGYSGAVAALALGAAFATWPRRSCRRAGARVAHGRHTSDAF
jgi:hypothetical protein